MTPKQSRLVIQATVGLLLAILGMCGKAFAMPCPGNRPLTSPPALQQARTDARPGFTGSACVPAYQDLDRDAQPDALFLDCMPGFASGHDRLTVYSTDGPLVSSSNWLESVDFENEVWVFDAGALGRASLIARFRREGDALVAELYDDQDGDGRVGYRVDRQGLRVSESQNWTVRVVAPAGWWHKADLINYNLRVLVDGPVLVTYGSDLFVNRLVNDGRVDYELLVRDREADGRPDYELRNAYPPVPESWAVYRSILISSATGDSPIENYIFWPYLGSSEPLVDLGGGTPTAASPYDTQGRAYGIVKGLGVSLPPIQVDWSSGRIGYVGEFVASHGSDKNWYIESITPIREGELGRPNFENPVGFYDLAEDADGVPELQIRIQYVAPGDPSDSAGALATAHENIRYSWDQDNDQTWDYKVDLVGRYEEESIVSFPELSVYTVPYDRLPYWVTEKVWDVVAFVAWESNKSWTSEGIYEWGAPREIESQYLSGIADTPPVGQYETIAEGFRGEYSFESGGIPRLYLSSLDRRLHLVGAEYGLWQVDGAHQVRYANLDSDAYLDQWQYIENAAVSSQLNLLGDLLVYGDRGQVVIKDFTASPVLLEARPPRNGSEWRSLGDQLERYALNLPAGDFVAALPLEGAETSIRGATLDDVRLTGSGFRFVLTLEQGFSVLADAHGLGANALPAGSYLVTYDGGFQVQPLSSPLVTVAESDIGFDTWPVQAAWTTVHAVVRNSGLRDASGLPLRLVATREGAEPQLLAEEEALVPGGGEYILSGKWWPAQPGDWQVRVGADSGAAQLAGIVLGPLASRNVQVEPAAMPAMAQLAGPYDGIRLSWPVFLLLGALLLTAVTLLIIVLRTGGRRSAGVHDREDARGSTDA